MYRIANIVLFVLAIFVVMGCSCSKTLCERNIQDDILNIDKFRKQSKKEYRYIEEDAERLFANSAAVYPDTLYRQQYTSLQGYFYGETGFDLYCIWYAQFNANNRKHYRCERKTLNKIFYCVNDMLRCIAGGGTGFAHETYRCPPRACGRMPRTGCGASPVWMPEREPARHGACSPESPGCDWRRWRRA